MDNRLSVLVVEDSQMAQMAIKAQLEKLGCSVDLAFDGESALKKALETPYDVILMDIGLGDGPDGFEVTIDIKKQSLINRKTPVMAVTARMEPEFHDRAAEVGMTDYFNKPFTMQDALKLLKYRNNPIRNPLDEVL